MDNIGVLLFDIDGVIRDVSNSYRMAIKKTVNKFCGWTPSILDIDSNEDGSMFIVSYL